MSKLILSLMAVFTLMSNVFAQSYYEVGKTYSYKSITSKGDKGVEIRVVFDEKGKATIKRIESTDIKDAQGMFILAPTNDFASEVSENTSSININNDIDKYWIINFDDESFQPLRNGTATSARVNVTCPCKGFAEGVECPVTIIRSGPRAGCHSCQLTTCKNCQLAYARLGNATASSALILKATSITFDYE